MTDVDKRVAQIVATIIGCTGIAILIYALCIFLGVPLDHFSDEPHLTKWGIWSGMLAIIVGQVFIWTANRLSPYV